MIVARRTPALAFDPPAAVPIRVFASQQVPDEARFCRYEVD